MQQEKLTTVSIVDALTQRLSDAIINGEWESGDKIQDTVIAERYGVSRNTVREACKTLIGKGFLVKLPNKGYFIPEFDESDIKELYGARLVVEQAAIEVLTNEKAVPKEMMESIESMRVQSPNYLKNHVNSVDYDFHAGLVRSLNNDSLFDYWENLFSEIMLINRQPHLFFPIEEIIVEHEKLIDAIKSGDVKEAKECLRKHMAISIERQIEELKAKGA